MKSVKCFFSKNVRNTEDLQSHFRASNVFPVILLVFMAKTKASQRSGAPSVAQLSELAKRFRKEAEEPAETPNPVEEPKPAEEPKPPRAKEPKPAAAVPEPAKVLSRVTGKRPAKKLDLLEDELFECDSFDPTDLDFQLSWDNFDKLKAFYEISDKDTTTILCAMCGLAKGKKYWSKFNVPMHLFDENGVFKPERCRYLESDAEMDEKESKKRPAGSKDTSVAAEAEGGQSCEKRTD